MSVTNDGEARIDAQLQAATLYTITIPASLSDRAGISLERDYQLRFFTAPAAPSLILPEANGRVIRALPGQTMALLTRRINLSELRLTLYRLDEATLLRALSLSDAEWMTFEPARYGLSLLRSWSEPLADPLNTTVESRVMVTLDDGSPPPPGIYFLRIRSPERVGIGVLLCISRAALSLQVAGQRAIVWTTDAVSATAIPDAPLSLYRQGSLIALGRSDERGVWKTDLTGVDPRNLIAVSSDPPAFATLDALPQNAPAPRLYVVLATDRTVYPPGERVLVRGFVRQIGAQSFDPPAPGQMLALEMHDPLGRSTSRQIVLDGTGAFETALSLPPNSPSGVYRISTPQDERVAVTFRVEAAAPLRVNVTRTVYGQDPALLVAVRTLEGLPVAGAIVDWTLDNEPLFFPTDDGTVFGKPDPPPSLSGTDVTDGNGILAIVIPSGSWHRYRFRAAITEPHGPAVTIERLIDAPPAPRVGLRAPLIVSAGAPATIEVTTLLGSQPLPAQRVRIEAMLLNREASDAVSPADRSVLSRVVVTNSAGRATVSAPLPAPGTYRVRASLMGVDPATPSTEITLHAYRPGFTDWTAPQGDAALLADRIRYRPGDTALILPLEPLPAALALLTVQQTSGDVREELRMVRAGEPVTLTLTPDDAPSVRVTLTPASHLPAQRRLQVDLPVMAPSPSLSPTLTADAQAYAPGTTAALTLTVTDTNGNPTPADVLVRVAPDADEPQETIMWRIDRTDDNGVLRIDVPLPRTIGVLPVNVWVASERGMSAISTRLIVTQPVVARIVAPPFARAGDQIGASVRLTSTDGITRETSVTLRFPDGTSTVQVATVPGEGVTSMPFMLRAPATATLEAQATVATGAAFSETLRTRLPILPPAATVISTGGALVTNRFETEIALPGNDPAEWGWLDIAIAPSLKALALDRVRALAAQTDRRALEDAAIILVAASLAEAGPETRAAITHLTGSQASDGGWAWQSGGRSNPAIVAIALEALASAKEAGFTLPDESLERATTLATRLARDPDVPLETRVCLSHALARLGVAELSLSHGWDESELDVLGLACRLLMLPPDQARVHPALPRLISLAQRAKADAWWRTPPGSAFPYDDTATTALVVQAIHYASPRHPLVTDAARWLIARMTPTGWGDALTTARVVQALRIAMPENTSATVALTFNGAPVTLPNTPDAMLRLVPIPLGDLRPTNTLVVTSSNAPALVAWQVTRAVSAPQTLEGVGLLREYLDPHTGALIDPTGLRPGQLVQVRLTIAAFHERRFVSVHDPFPAGFALVDPGVSSIFDHIDAFNDRVELTAATLAPGIYQHTYLMRASVPGAYAAPPPELILPGDRALAGTATANLVRIEAP
ncbi:MAG: MG2 domain-containing protein [Roseiflexaceae bacterium]|nr:MG2 domain-containing protein [Roseiflexaceae bacterium]